MVVGSQLQAEVIDKATPQAVHEYQSMIGSIMYPMVQTRPDICYAVIMLSRYNQNLNATHIKVAKRVIRYLKGTLDHGVFYGTSDGLEGFTDADWAFDTETRRFSAPMCICYLVVLSVGHSSDSNPLLYSLARPSIWPKRRPLRRSFGCLDFSRS